MKLAASISAGALIVVYATFMPFYALASNAHGAERICGTASFYGTESGSRTYTGEAFNGTSMTAAMPSTRHIGERWRVTYRGKSVVVRINDYGPRADLHRIIDLSKAAAREIGLIPAGVGRVCLERLS